MLGFKKSFLWRALRRSDGWAQRMLETVQAFKKRHPGASAERGREGILAAARQRLPNDVKLSTLRSLQQKLGVAEER